MNETNFVDAILASPDDHALRLVYADWLDEQGDPRAEFLRVAHEMSQTSVCTARYRKLRVRRDALAKHCDPGWLKAMTRLPIPEIRHRLEKLDRLDEARSVFASDSHQYGLNPSLAVERVEEIESRIGVRLPEQYRRFVTEFADGGGGPYYGIRPLASLLESTTNPEWLASLATPFPSVGNAKELESLGYAPPGTLEMCEYGCGAGFHLILTGPERGQVWCRGSHTRAFSTLI